MQHFEVCHIGIEAVQTNPAKEGTCAVDEDVTVDEVHKTCGKGALLHLQRMQSVTKPENTHAPAKHRMLAGFLRTIGFLSIPPLRYRPCSYCSYLEAHGT